MPRKFAHKVDVNQSEIVAELRKLGCSVCILSSVGAGCPDILCGKSGRNWLFEVKNGGKKLTFDEQLFHDTWNGQVNVIENTKDALVLMGVI